MSFEEFCDLFEAEARARWAIEVDGREVMALLPGEIRPEMVEAVRRCCRAARDGLLTNNFVAGEATTCRPVRSARACSALFDVVSSRAWSASASPTRASTRSPAPTLGIEPTEAVFLDDLGVNLKPARAMGMTTIKVVDPAVALAELEQVVGFPLA